MFESFKSTIADLLARPAVGTANPSFAGFRSGPAWRLSPWWPGENLGAKQHSLLRLLSFAHKDRLELSTLVTNLAQEHRGRFRRRLFRLARRLGEGTALVDALEQTPDVLRDDQVLALRFGTQSGTLDETYQQLLSVDHTSANRITASLRQTMLYAVACVVFVALMVWFTMTFLAPTINQIYGEFGFGDEDLPWAFRSLESAFDHFVRNLLWWLLGICSLAWLVWYPGCRRFFRRSVSARLLRGVAQSRSADLLRMLSLTVEKGRPLPASLSMLARYHFDKSVRQQLMFARIEAEHRSDIWNILSEARLLTADESNALAKASSNESRVWMMRRIADWKEDRVFRRREMLATLIRPAVILVLGSVVLMVGLAWIGVLSQASVSLAKYQ
ncbi:MAG: type II secretion system F family protein [Rubripirellula sp.]